MLQGNEIFRGVEAEGRLKGVPTIFSRMVDPEAVDQGAEDNVTHIFFGFRCHVLTPADFDRLKKICDDYAEQAFLFTVHVPLRKASAIPSWVWPRCHVLLYQDTDVVTLLGHDVELRLQDEQHCAVYGRPEIIPVHYVHDRPVR